MSFLAPFFHFVIRLGGPGLLLLGVLDSSYLVAPWGNDVLIILLTAHHRGVANMLYFAAMSTIGSVLGCLLLDVTIRPLGEKGLERHLSKRRLARVKRKAGESTGKALALASLTPPPFPFTAFVLAAAALQYPRKRFIAVIGVTRLVRFVAVGVLGLLWGTAILKWARSPLVQDFAIGLVMVSLVASAISVYGWLKGRG
jgi:membrane protein YqaA with SNARE-associated domain